jgi:putative ABC transport system permease protein
MALFQRVIGGFRALFWKTRQDQELDAELVQFLESSIEQKIRAGLSRDEALRAARLELGSVAAVKDRVRDVGWESVLDSVGQDLRYAIRSLRKSPAFAAAAIVTLALGIGANTGIFGLIEALLLRSLPVHDPVQLVQLVSVLRVQRPQTGENFSYPQVRHLADQHEMFLGLCGFSGDTFNVGPPDALRPVAGAWVTEGFYQTLGLVPVAGRLLGPDDDRPGASPAAVITDNYWAREFGRDPGAIGRPLLIEGIPVAIVGVSPPGFNGAIVGEAAEVTLAVNVLPQLQPERAFMVGPGGRWLKILARPREELPRTQIKARLAVVWAQYLSATVSSSLPADARARALSSTLDLRAGTMGASPLRSQFREPLLVLMGMVGLVLLIACVNVANLQLARAAARQREMAVRLALGASRRRIVRQLLTESALLAAAGAGLGIVLASFGSQVLVNLISNTQSGPTASAAIALDLGLNLRVLVFTAVIAGSTTLFFGLAPAFRAAVVEPNVAMSVNSRRVAASGGRLASALVTAQVSVSLLLLIGAGLFVRTLHKLRTLDRGFRHEGVLLVDVDASRAGYKGPRLKAFNQEMLAMAERLPDVASASMSSITPLMGGGISMPIAVNGQPVGSGEMHFNQVAPRYFETLNTPFVLGRDFTVRDDATAPGVAIVNEAFVRQYLPNGRPLEQRVSVVGSPAEREVVGVVKDAVYETLRQTPPPTVYIPYLQSGGGGVTLEIFAAGSLAQVESTIRAEVQPKLAGKPMQIRTLTARLERSLVQERLMATLASAFGLLALALASVGLYGVLAYAVVRRTGEIGIRMALGARRTQVLALVLNSALRMLALGTLLGLPAAWVTSRVIASMLFGLTVDDPTTIAGAVTALLVTGIAAAYIPARRATRIEPLVALRCE